VLATDGGHEDIPPWEVGLAVEVIERVCRQRAAKVLQNAVHTSKPRWTQMDEVWLAQAKESADVALRQKNHSGNLRVSPPTPAGAYLRLWLICLLTGPKRGRFRRT